MSLPRYPKYKTSGVEWLGEVPAHWTLKPVKAIASCNDEVLSESTPEEFEIDYVEISDVEYGQGITSTTTMPFGAAPSRARRRLADGDVLISTVRTYLRAIAPLSKPSANLIASTGFAVIRPRSLHSGFLGYALQSEYFISKVISSSVGVSYPAINASQLMGIITPVPDRREQFAIASFLDRETAKIDALVTEQERLIALLKEKRQAVISHAVTKGLNPDTSMKPSGVEWLGDVPRHWEVRALRTLSAVVRGASPRPAGNPTLFNGDFVPWVTVAEITKDGAVELHETADSLTEKGAEASRLFKAGCVIYSNSGATLGVPKILRIDACANDGVVGFESLDRSLLPIYLYHYLFSLTPIIRDMVKQGSGQPNLNTDIVKAIPIALPPVEEQQAIAAFLEAEGKTFNALAAEMERAIHLLKERRATLISAAVTGQIDVRNAA